VGGGGCGGGGGGGGGVGGGGGGGGWGGGGGGGCPVGVSISSSCIYIYSVGSRKVPPASWRVRRACRRSGTSLYINMYICIYIYIVQVGVKLPPASWRVRTACRRSGTFSARPPPHAPAALSPPIIKQKKGQPPTRIKRQTTLYIPSG